jgi:hypothetical protein
MRGRRPAGPEYVDQVPGSQTAKERARIILQTLAGTLRLGEACRLLGVSPQRFHQLRAEALAGLVASLELGVPGRPPQTPSPEDEQLRALEVQLAAQDLELRAARAREEIALTLPRVVHERPSEKKTPRRPRGRPPGKRTNT